MEDYVASVFISYAHEDRPLARAIRAKLEEYGCRVWIDEGELRVGDSLIERISEALDRVDFVGALVSPYSVGGDWCRKELSLAMTGEIKKRGVVVLPLRVDNTPMPDSMKDKLFVDVRRTHPSAAADELMKSIRGHLSPPAPLPPRRARPANSAAARDVRVDEEPVRIVGIDEESISQPRADASRG